MVPEEFFAAAATDTGRIRKNNEDTALAEAIVHRGVAYTLLVVADGMGGGAKGEVASSIAAQALFEYLRDGAWDDPGTALVAGFHLANDAVHRHGTGNGELESSAMGTTLVAALVDEAAMHAWVCNVGDSRAYVLRERGLKQVTRDHSLVAEQVAAGDLTKDEARVARGRNVVTRAIGPEPEVEPDLKDSSLDPHDRLLLCSDGLHGMLDDRAIEKLLRSTSLAAAPRTLVDAANRAGGRDNVTVVVGGRPATGEADPDATIVIPPGGYRSRRRVPVLLVAGVAALSAGVAAAVWLMVVGGGEANDAAAGTARPAVAESSASAAPPGLTQTPRTAGGGAATPTPPTNTPPAPTPTLAPTAPPAVATSLSSPTADPTPPPTPVPPTSPPPPPTATPTPSTRSVSVRIAGRCRARETCPATATLSMPEFSQTVGFSFTGDAGASDVMFSNVPNGSYTIIVRVNARDFYCTVAGSGNSAACAP